MKKRRYFRQKKQHIPGKHERPCLLGNVSVVYSAKGRGWKNRQPEIVKGLHAMQKGLNFILYSGEPAEDSIREVEASNLHFTKVILVWVVKSGTVQRDLNRGTS